MRLFRRVAMAQHRRKDALLRQHGLQPGQDIILVELWRLGPCSQAELAAAAEVDEPSVTRSVVRLERRGLLSRSPDPADSRRRIVTLSAEGAALIPTMQAIYEQITRELLGDAGDVAYLVDRLTDIATRLGREDPEQAPAPPGH